MSTEPRMVDPDGGPLFCMVYHSPNRWAFVVRQGDTTITEGDGYRSERKASRALERSMKDRWADD